MNVPQGFEKWCGRGGFLLLLKAIYGTKQAASRFWVLLQSVFLKLSYRRSNADPCVFHKWSEEDGLAVWLSWVDDCLWSGNKESFEEFNEKFKKEFEVDGTPSTTPGADPPRDARDLGSARSKSTHLETSSSDRP